MQLRKCDYVAGEVNAFPWCSHNCWASIHLIEGDSDNKGPISLCYLSNEMKGSTETKSTRFKSSVVPDRLG